MKKWKKTTAAFMAAIGFGVFPADVTAISAPASVSKADFINVTELFNDAYTAYADAKLAENAGVRSEKYAEAISYISRAVVADPENLEALLLASQIYRAKGASSYAKDYFSRAEKLMLSAAKKNPDDAGTRVDYAIACFAGEPRFGDEYGAYQKKAKKSADEAMRILKKMKAKNGAQLRAMALANLVKGNAEECEKLLAAAAEKEPVSRHYLDMYNDTVKRGKWLWPVGKDSAAKEFLLYTLTDTLRWSGM